MRAVSLLAGSAVATTVLAFAPGDVSDPGTRIDEVFAPYNRTDSPGCAVGVIQDGRLTFARGYGMASLELGVPNTPQTVFYIGSTSKQFVAAAAVLAEMDGYLSLDDDIRDYVPEIPDYGHTITIRHLIHHTSGLRDYLSLMAMGGWPYENVYTDAWTLDLIARQRALNFEPGTTSLYSNSGYYVLAEVVGRATGSTLREYTDRRMFQPLGMVHTHFHDDRRMVVPNRAMAYSTTDEGPFQLEWYPNFDKVGSGGLLTTVEDLVRWDGTFYDDQLGEGFVEQMLERGVLDDGEVLDYAFGLAHGSYQGRATVRHGGAFMGFRAELLRFPEAMLSVTVLCNLAATQPARLAEQVADIFLDPDANPPANQTVLELSLPPRAALPTETLDGLAGNYRDIVRRTVWHFSVHDGALRVEGGPIPMTLSPVDAHHFVAVDAPVPVEAYVVPDGSGFRISVNDVAWGTLEPVETVSPSPETLAEYVGRYYSEELDATFTLAVDGDALTLHRGQMPSERLAPTTADAFQRDGMTLEFSRTDGRLSGITLTSGRVRGVVLTREH